MKGLFEAEKALYELVPDLVPKPVAWGIYKSDPDTAFFMSEFVEMYDDLPTPSAWAGTVSQLHLNSMGKSPTGKFGFHSNTHLANVPINNAWNSSWEAFWAQQMKSLFDQEEKLNGPDETLAELRTAYFEKALPRYLRPLETEGRSIELCLVHSDLWPGNIKRRTATDELCMFDSCAYWGHNEGKPRPHPSHMYQNPNISHFLADLAVCYNIRYKLGQPCLLAYEAIVPASEPTADFAARNAVYAMKYHVLLSVMYWDKQADFRQVLINELTKLLERDDMEVQDKTSRL